MLFNKQKMTPVYLFRAMGPPQHIPPKGHHIPKSGSGCECGITQNRLREIGYVKSTTKKNCIQLKNVYMLKGHKNTLPRREVMKIVFLRFLIYYSTYCYQVKNKFL